MSSSEIFADLHCHPTLNPFCSGKSIWEYSPPIPVQRKAMINSLSRFNQCDLTAVSKANVRLIFVALYPVEQGFLTRLMTDKSFRASVQTPVIREAGLLIKDLLGTLVNGLTLGNPSQLLSKAVYNMKREVFLECTSPEHDYFEYLLKEYQYLVNGLSASDTNSNQEQRHMAVRIVQSYTELQDLLNIDANSNPTVQPGETICIVPTVEGAHALGCGQLNTVIDDDFAKETAILNNLDHPATKKLKEKLDRSISVLKSNSSGTFTPLFITMAHHFWNQLCGHSMSFSGIMHGVFEQSHGMGYGFTELGRHVVRELLSGENGKRILIDVKHMSLSSRLEFYKRLLPAIEEKEGVRIPIIASHVGVNGCVTMEDSRNLPSFAEMDRRYKFSKDADKEFDKRFNNWDINLSDEEILIIHRSKGIIGLNLDQRILSGQAMVDFMERTASRFRDAYNYSLLYRSVWAQPILENIYHILHTVFKNSNTDREFAFEMICVGSDYDGMINALDAFCYVEDFASLREVLRLKMVERAKIDPILPPDRIDEFLDGFFYKNLINFYERTSKIC